MINTEQIQVEQEETENLIKNLKEIRLNFARTGTINEDSFKSISDRLDLRQNILNFIDTKIEILEINNDDLKGQIEFSESYYEN